MEENNTDEIEICQNIEPHEDDNSVKSKAVVKFANFQVPAKFTRLQCNTDLNLPPSNWLSNSPGAHGLHQSIYHSPGFASFRMAHMFPDCLGEVDVVSDAENIKTLLKLPYAPKTPISMMVHKIGNTLLIDEFDIQKYLLRKADDDWKWLKTFILENILSSLGEKDRNFCLKDKSRRALQRKNLLSKFLYHSLQQSSGSTTKDSENTNNVNNCFSTNTRNDDNIDNDVATENRPLLLSGPILPDPNIEENVPDPNHTDHVFNRNVVWTFEDIRMLIGTDMPIFGGGTRPCISLRLRDMTKPINVLTGIDYWLDNLMCNVPEVVMCYHLDGIVQKYELIKTEDLPYLEDSTFSPQVIRNVAQNILAFLKANATKAGHTYWLFKGKNDDVVKLYDLTTLCSNTDNNCDDDIKYENPFTVPVAMLLYTVARNMKNTSEKISSKKAGSIKILLDNCIKLLSKEKFPQIVTSSHYILSDLHVPDGIDPISPNFDNGDVDSDTQSIYDEDYNLSNEYESSDTDKNHKDDNEDNDMNDNVAVKSICETLKEFNGDNNLKNNQGPSPLVATIEERCKIALQHISHGIDCLQYFSNKENENAEEKEENDTKEKEKEKQKIIQEEQNPNMAKPFQPIPLPYEKLKPEPKMANPNVAIPMRWEEKKNNNSSKNKKKFDKNNKTKDKNKTEDKSIPTTTNNNNNNNNNGNGANGINHKIVVRDNTQKFGTWDNHLKLLLLEKACLTYTTLAEHNYVLENYGSSLKNIYMAYRCQKIVINYMPSLLSQKSALITRAGDCLYKFVQNDQKIDLYLEQYQDMSKFDNVILNLIKKDTKKDEFKELPEPRKNIENLMVLSCNCYNVALESADNESRINILRHLGTVKNELGLRYMSSAEDKRDESKNKNGNNKIDIKDEQFCQILIIKSYDCLNKAVQIFEEINDTLNLSFVLCNLGRFMRFKAHFHLNGEMPDDVNLIKKYYCLAFTYYERVLNIIGSREQNPELWDLCYWDFSTSMFLLAKHVQDYSNKNDLTNEEAQEINDLLLKSLKLCDVKTVSSRQVSYEYRSGLIYYRLALFHHSQIRKLENDNHAMKIKLQLCRLYYEKAEKILLELKEVKDCLYVQLERISLQEFIAEGANSSKIKSLQTALNICLETKIIFDHIKENDIDKSTVDEVLKLLKCFEKHLQFVLKTLAKICSSTTASKELTKIGNVYKQMYSATLSISKIEDEKKFAEHLSNVLEKISQMQKENK